jgi:hypothetical protein
LNCETFLDRLYDDDARTAGRGLSEMPPDMAAHLLACDTCRAAYDAARADDLLLTHALIDVPSPAWRAEALRRISRSQRASWSQRITSVNEIVIGGILAVAASQVLLVESSTAASIAAFSAGGAAALLRSNLSRQLPALRRPLRWV